ncbi:putative curli production assembly/transport component csgg precursor [Oceanicola granulosus HTCC2516]|uniref:Putative curli production assembly/transport component csgg n=1 Tax=Oceanicola granulosus (strain ATCC BAA-861 / DSM 15982 / KCTC 12143 / HTCC2516) TaxID=314256 RepID=Q2CEK2_OCEGH|nr:CsgG/HfaB family protein [Oceanicola granulosus]EAR51130.1 putative curli production assembly/transport component csgg precursor [Oceanicola granulosus HTCC2516]
MSATSTGLTVERLPPPVQPLDIAVYAFPDLTGQNEPNENYSELSRAVTQGGADILTDVLAKAGNGQWFNVVERARVDNLLRERTIIEQTQTAFTGGVSLPPLRFAGTLIEGSIVGYDTNTVTGGAGARYLGIGSFNEYRKDVVTVALRAVSVSTGRVLTSVTTTKTVYSVRVQGGAFRFVAIDEILEFELGYSRNEPEIFATREAMELAVLAMIVEGAEDGQWAFADAAAGSAVIQNFRRRYELARLGYSPEQIEEMYGPQQES